MYVLGSFTSSTLTLNNGKSLSNVGAYDGYIAKYNNNGLCLWVERIAGSDDSDGLDGIISDNFGNVYVTGLYKSSTLNFNNGISLSNSGDYDIFLAKFNDNGLCLWAKRIFGSGDDRSGGITINSNYIYLNGSFQSSILNFNNNLTLTNSGYNDIFIAKYDISGNCLYVDKIGGTQNDISINISSTYNNLYLIGSFESSELNFNNNITLNLTSGMDAFIAKYNIDMVSVPTLITTRITHISSNRAKSGGEITDDGGADITARGVCWSTSQSPTIANSKTNDGIEVGQFTSNLIDLEPNTHYFVRAYATNSMGTSYGEEISFKTANFDIPLNSGWNLISTYIKPQAPDTMNNVMSEISNNLLIAKNNGGQVFIPSYEINTIGRWDVTQGYLVYMSAVDTLSIFGSEVVPSETPIQLSAGWNTIGYLRNAEFSAEQSFTSITDNNNLLIAKTLDGKVYIPSYSINTIGNLKPGVGYKVYVSNPDILYYNSGTVNYETVTIGTQEWKLKNLDVTHYRNGDPIPQVTDPTQWANLTTGAWCYYNNDSTNGTIYGKLYNWYAVNDPRGLAPIGYHIASDQEWATLFTFLGSLNQY